uniref:Fibronectin type-III domain-containing protein n=1 Tax=Octopus bimaculoides TaxID=37653 RepID=A0A0L8FTW7_OCTBM
MSKNADIEQHQKSVHGDRHSLTLKDLDPNTQYLVQVQAIVQVGKKRYRSTKETMQMVTDSEYNNVFHIHQRCVKAANWITETLTYIPDNQPEVVSPDL